VADGPSVQLNIQQHYANVAPGQVQVLGADLYNGTAAQLRSFKTQTGATYPLLLLGASSTGGNLSTLYGTFDNYVVISRQGIVRYHAADLWPHGNRYHLGEIRACVDSLIGNTTGVPEDDSPPALSIEAAPNPFSIGTSVRIVNAAGAGAELAASVHDVAGRLVATLWNGPAPSDETVVRWDGRTRAGDRAPSGVYLVSVETQGRRAVTRVVHLR
jgi:hypothetical protein